MIKYMPKKYNEFIIKEDYAIMLVNKKNTPTIEVLLDIEDVDRVREVGSWHAIYDKTLQIPNYYICHRDRNKEVRRCLKLHRFVMNCPENKVVDHINHNTIDNRKSNLRICSHFENAQNQLSKKTQQAGVSYRKPYIRKSDNSHVRGYWNATISKNNKRYDKCFQTYEEAVAWRKEQERILYGIEE